MQEKEPQWSVALDAYIKLADEDKYPEFNIKVVKDEGIVLKKAIRLDESDVQLILVKTDETKVNGITLARKQVQAVPAYALTMHKSQGLTMLMVHSWSTCLCPQCSILARCTRP